MFYSITLVSQNFALRNKFVEFCQKNEILKYNVFASSKGVLDFLAESTTEFLFVDFLLSDYDGLQLLKTLLEKGHKKCVFVVSKNFKTIIKKAFDYGAFKIVDYDFLFEDVFSDFSKQEPSFSLENYISKLCIEVGITPYLSGYKYVKEAILLMVSEPERYKNVTKTLYPKIAEKFNSSAIRVERSIRHALNTANTSEKIEKLNEFLNIKALNKGERITNSQFILTVADRLLYKISVESSV